MQGEYLLNSAAAQMGQRFSGLEATFDAATCGISLPPGSPRDW